MAGGVVGGFGGAFLARHLAQKKGALNLAFAGLILVVAAYMFWKSAATFLA